MDANLFSIIDTIVKIGLGALISGFLTYMITRLQHKNELSKTKFKRRQELIEEIAAQIEDFSSAVLIYWAYMIEHVRYSGGDKKIPADLPGRIKASEKNLFDKFNQLASAEGKLIVFGSAKAQELLREYGDYIRTFRRAAWQGNKSLKEADLETYRTNIVEKRKSLYKEIRAMYEQQSESR
jgi:Sec-independent protein translocase protein TatA